MNIGDKYVLKALDNYPCYLEETLESLSYALSYDKANTMALTLMGRVYAEQLFDYEKAKAFFQEALCQNIYAVEVYPYFIQLLLETEEYDEAQKTIEFALTIKGINKASILVKKVLLLEKQRYFKKALKALNKLKLNVLQIDVDLDLKGMEERIKQKRDIQKKKLK